MRRHVAIPAKSAVAAALLLTGAIYLAAEIRQAMLRRYSVATNSVEPASAGLTQTAENSGPSLPQIQAEPKPEAIPAATAKQRPSDELAAERQAAKIPAQKAPKKAAQDSHTRQIIISVPDRRLALLQDGELLKVYPVAVGAEDTPSPDGEFTVINHAANPSYWHEGKEVPPGKNNPIGTRWIGLSLKGYGIHGTNVQSSVGKPVSHGCFRMKKKDVEELYARVQVGDKVSVRSERDELTASLFKTSTNTVVMATSTKTETQVASAAAVATTDEEQ
ncbi:MAG TPA: L,D-transpeptidase [Candidatus Angelobacter sp.]|nr:L,D-transpeptidase [Candidatus Angelobacter sp.]